MNDDLDKIYEIRFSGLEEYRNDVWKILVNQFIGKWINPNDTILDLGCGYGEFIDHTNAMVRVKKHPLFMVSLYLRFPFLWKLFGKQFLIVAQKD